MHIFVGNLEFSATEQDVRQLFERYGVVDTVRIMTDRETGRPRGFGFVEMSDDEARPREERPRPRRERW
jgi:RNA recognition motif-containing protein